jgi:hypothetical protein
VALTASSQQGSGRSAIALFRASSSRRTSLQLLRGNRTTRGHQESDAIDPQATWRSLNALTDNTESGHAKAMPWTRCFAWMIMRAKQS